MKNLDKIKRKEKRKGEHKVNWKKNIFLNRKVGKIGK